MHATNEGRRRQPVGSRHRASLPCMVLCLLWLALPARGRGQELAASERVSSVQQEAGSHFDRGVELYSEGSLDAALAEFERAYELVPSYKLLFNLAQIQAERHEYGAAIGLLERYLADGGEEISEARAAETRAELSKLRERVAELWVESDVEAAELFVNDALVGTLPLSAPVVLNPGISRLRVEKSGYRAATRELKVTGGDTPRLAMPLRPIVDEPSAPSEGAATTKLAANYTPLWIASATTLALGGAALTFGLLARATDGELERELDSFPPNEAKLADQRTQLKTFAGLSDGFAAASAVGLGVAIYFLVAPPLAPERPRAAAERAAVKSLRLLPRGRGVALHGNF